MRRCSRRREQRRRWLAEPAVSEGLSQHTGERGAGKEVVSFWKLISLYEKIFYHLWWGSRLVSGNILRLRKQHENFYYGLTKKCACIYYSNSNKNHGYKHIGTWPTFCHFWIPHFPRRKRGTNWCDENRRELKRRGGADPSGSSYIINFIKSI